MKIFRRLRSIASVKFNRSHAVRHLLAGAIAVLLLTSCASVVNQFVYTPTALPEPAQQWAQTNDATTFEVITDDGITLTGMQLSPKGTPRDTILYFHGNGGNLIKAATFVKPLRDRGYDVYVATYRGYSGNPGTPREVGLMKDGEAFLRSTKTKPIVIGFSLGGAVALHLAAKTNLKAVTTIGAFTSLRAMTKVPTLTDDRYDNIAAIKQITEPVLLVHGTKDHVVPFEQSRLLREAAVNHNVRLYRLEGADHEIDAEVFAELFDEQMSQLPTSVQ